MVLINYQHKTTHNKMHNTFHKSHIQPVSVPDAVSTNHVLKHDGEMNRDEVSQISAKHFPAMLKDSPSNCN